eukprot:TRINITY_DN34535_c0_g1_i1.p1 TRINITY_DN34535_c0_g1~~TRINITY_DN34535_c0_g1_i1.p1  ORF type:complete len:642 (+),score=71.91 TRINITY_DN34535_c0_g1_i1:57-1982(+)
MMAMLIDVIVFVLFSALFRASDCVRTFTARSFTVQNDMFVKDGDPFNIRSGSLHYFRVPKPYWRDRLQRMKSMGLNTVSMYVPWNYHEEVEGIVTGIEDISKFLDIANEEKMLVIFRAGPYICGEWELGGFPAWLLFNDRKGIKLRTFESQYISAVQRWLSIVYDLVRDKAYGRGGPIIIVSIENEFGFFGDCQNNADDAKYMNFLLDLATRFFGDAVIYTTVDQPLRLDRGSPWRRDPRVIATVDGVLSDGAGYAEAFGNQKDFNAPGKAPKMWSELWVGWFTVWGWAKVAGKTGAEVHKGISAIVAQQASFSLYLAHGGTNFGFWSGANGGQHKRYEPDITSYDYRAPISEAGTHGIGWDGKDLFIAVKDAIAAAHGQPSSSEPDVLPMTSYGQIKFSGRVGLFDHLDQLSACNYSVKDGDALPSFEDLRFKYGLVLYSHTGSFKSTSVTFTSEATHDRAQLFVDDKEVGTAYRPLCPTEISIPEGSDAKLLVENMGRINFGHGMYEHKGYLGKPPISGSWVARCLPLLADVVRSLPFGSQVVRGPIFQRGTLHIVGEPADTWLDMFGFTKGYVWANGHNLGRFWETMGPQYSLYLPGAFLRKGNNEIIVLDLHLSSSDAPVSVMSAAAARDYSRPKKR